MTRMTRPDCAVMCNLINTHTHPQVLCRHEFYVTCSRLWHRALTIVYMVTHHTYSKSMDQPGKVANPARGQLNR